MATTPVFVPPLQGLPGFVEWRAPMMEARLLPPRVAEQVARIESLHQAAVEARSRLIATGSAEEWARAEAADRAEAVAAIEAGNFDEVDPAHVTDLAAKVDRLRREVEHRVNQRNHAIESGLPTVLTETIDETAAWIASKRTESARVVWSALDAARLAFNEVAVLDELGPWLTAIRRNDWKSIGRTPEQAHPVGPAADAMRTLLAMIGEPGPEPETAVTRRPKAGKVPA